MSMYICMTDSFTCDISLQYILQYRATHWKLCPRVEPIVPFEGVTVSLLGCMSSLAEKSILSSEHEIWLSLLNI